MTVCGRRLKSLLQLRPRQELTFAPVNLGLALASTSTCQGGDWTASGVRVLDAHSNLIAWSRSSTSLYLRETCLARLSRRRTQSPKLEVTPLLAFFVEPLGLPAGGRHAHLPDPQSPQLPALAMRPTASSHFRGPLPRHQQSPPSSVPPSISRKGAPPSS